MAKKKAAKKSASRKGAKKKSSRKKTVAGRIGDAMESAGRGVASAAKYAGLTGGTRRKKKAAKKK